MKLILQITLGVLLGTLASQLVMDKWQAYQAQKSTADIEQYNQEQRMKEREILKRQLRGQKPAHQEDVPQQEAHSRSHE